MQCKVLIVYYSEQYNPWMGAQWVEIIELQIYFAAWAVHCILALVRPNNDILPYRFNSIPISFQYHAHCKILNMHYRELNSGLLNALTFVTKFHFKISWSFNIQECSSLFMCRFLDNSTIPMVQDWFFFSFSPSY